VYTLTVHGGENFDGHYKPGVKTYVVGENIGTQRAQGPIPSSLLSFPPGRHVSNSEQTANKRLRRLIPM